MSSKTPNPRNSERGIRSYVTVGKDYTEIMRTPTLYGVEWQNYIQKHSEFEKPYLQDYPEMQYQFPPLPDPSFIIPIWEWPIWGPEQTVNLEQLGKVYPCAISCWKTGLDCDDPVGCIAILMNIGPGGTWSVIEADGPYGSTWVNWGSAEFFDFFIEAPDDGWTILTGENKRGGVNLRIQLEDLAGIKGTTRYYAMCRPTECPVDFTYDPNNPETIDQNDSKVITVIDGLSPFSWSVAGTGFSFSAATTMGQSNVLLTDDTACGLATITVTDDCGTVVASYIKCTTGQWVLKPGFCVMAGGGNCTKHSTVTFYYISGYQRWRVWGYQHCCDHPTYWADYEDDTCIPPSCGNPADCCEHTFCGTGPYKEYRSITWSRYYEWGC